MHQFLTRHTTAALLATGLMISPWVIEHAEAVQAGPDRIYTITPCRILDTRLASGVFAGKLAPNDKLAIRTWGSTIISQGGSGSQCPDVPSDATGVFINVQAAEPTGGSYNYIGVKPYGSEDASTALNYNPASGAIGNSQLVATCYGQWIYGAFASYPCGSFDLEFNNGPNASTDLVVDITGFTRNY